MKSNLNDTIVSISTALANGAISIVRLSGDDALNIVMASFKGKDLRKVESHTINYGYLYDGSELVDEVLVSVFLPPKSYTKEIVVEINCHGGIYVTNKILALMVKNGARIAQAGEFTKRAFVNGRIDLTQAEAVMDMIEAQSKQSLKLAGIGLKGEVKELINSLRSKLLEVVVMSEANIDYPEYEDTVFKKDNVKTILNEVLLSVTDILNKSDSAQALRYGIKTAIIGRPNVGKSSILNGLLDEDKAIVSNIAGTTRDTIEADLNVGGIILHLIDTAGIRSTDDVVEKIGVSKAKEKLAEASLVILVFDNSEKLTKDDLSLLEITENKPRVIIVNKSDLKGNLDYNVLGEYILISSFKKEDIEKVKSEILNVCSISDVTDVDATFISSARQIGLLNDAKSSIEECINLVNDEREIDLIAMEVKNAYESLSGIVGEEENTDFVEEIFKRFCLGK